MFGLSLFSGIGGIDVALSPWVRTIAYCEIEPYCQSVLLQRMQEGNLSKAPIWDDIRTLSFRDLPDIDIIFGGSPCQDISVAGAGKGLEGERSGLIFEVFRILDETKAPFIFLENVPNIRTKGAERICKELAERGYDCRWCCLSAADVGAVHKRERWFLLAYSKGERSNRQWGSTSGNETSLPMPSLLCEDDCNAMRITSKQADKGTKSIEEERETWRGFTGQYWPFESRADWQKIVSEVCRVDDGIPCRLYRIKSLGNAVVPIQVREAFNILFNSPSILKS